MSASAPSLEPAPQNIVLRNVLILVVAQALTTPLSVLTNAVMGRYIGPEEFGHLYLATTTASCAFLFVDWGTGGTLPANIAKDRTRAGEFLGTALAWRLVAAVVVGVVLAAGTLVLKSEPEFRAALSLVILASTIATVSGIYQDTARGFERSDVTAYASVGGQFLAVLLVVPTLLLGGRLQAALTAQLVSGGIVLVFVWRTVRRANVGALTFRVDTLKSLLHEGAPFLFFGIAMVLQPYVDATFLSTFAHTESLGWFAASKRLVGVLVYPAGALISALYPTLCRLHTEDIDGYKRTVRGSLRSATTLVVPVALGCALFPDVGIGIFGRKAFGPAEDDLRVLAVFVFLVYFSMVLGIALLAAGRARAWAFVQFLCVVVSVVVDPLLIPWFQAHTGNGGLGVCWANVASEVLMVAGGIWLTPAGVFDRGLIRELGLALLGGGAMTLVARVLLMWGIPSLVVAPLSVAAYGACLLATGGLDKAQLEALRSAVARKVKRKLA